MSKFTTLIFDFDGTLVDSLLPNLETYMKVAKDFNIQIEEDLDLQTFKKLSAKDIIKRYKIGPLKLKKFLAKSFEEINKELDQLKFFPEILETLTKLSKDYRLGILSSNSQENVENFLKNKKINIFDFVYTGHNLFGKDKIFQQLIKNHNLVKDEILYFGDELRDIEACKKVGIKVTAVSWGFDDLSILKEANPDYLISSPKDLEKILKI